jgi:hypothetical protein
MQGRLPTCKWTKICKRSQLTSWEALIRIDRAFVDSTTGREYATIVWNDSDQITYTSKWLELKCPQKVLVTHLFAKVRWLTMFGKMKQARRKFLQVHEGYLFRPLLTLAAELKHHGHPQGSFLWQHQQNILGAQSVFAGSRGYDKVAVRRIKR